jgi:hypothetical protein
MRNELIEEAVTSTVPFGGDGVYKWRVFEDDSENNANATKCADDPRRTTATRIFSEAMHAHAKRLALGAYHHLVQKLRSNPVIGSRIFHDVVVMLKGSNAHLYYNNRVVDETFNVSDSDIVVCILNTLPPDVFAMIKHQVEISVRQTLSQYKRLLDQMLFLADASVPDEPDVATFKKEFTSAVEAVKTLDNGEDLEGEFISPFRDTESRNKCSRYSFLITNSKVSANKVLVHVPHYDQCERIPLRKTPMFTSVNNSLDFERNANATGCKGKFTLHRMKMNIIHRRPDGYDDKVPIDFLDISVPDRDDEELKHFWEQGMYVSVFEPTMNLWVAIPDLPTCISELQRILDDYDSTEPKREKRMRKLAALRHIFASYF